jgi:RecB family exonuclease
MGQPLRPIAATHVRSDAAFETYLSMAVPTTARLPRKFSPSALGMYEECPKQFEFAYLLKPEVEEALSPHLVVGNAVHEALAFLYRLPVEERSESALHRALRHHWARIPDRDQAFLTESEEREWGLRTLSSLSDYASRYDLRVRPLMVEDWIEARLPNGRVVCGRADRIDRSLGERPGIEVIDYKTGRCRISDEDVAGLISARLYALAATRTLHEPVVKVRFVYVTEGLERAWSPTGEDLAAIEAELVELTDRVSSDELFEPRPARMRCRWCSYASLCPARDESSLTDLNSAERAVF